MAPENQTPAPAIDIDTIAAFCRRKGFVYPSSEIYGGLSGFFDYGPYGAELFNNIKQHFWKTFVHDKDNMVGMEATIISHPQVWVASGHVAGFGDKVLACSKCNSKVRADHFIQEQTGKNLEGLKAAELNAFVQEHKLVCPKCKGAFKEVKDFNMLFKTNVGADEGTASVAYMRGETAQGMFTDFKIITDTTRQKLPFGIVQVGRCFRNEISPRDFMFRSREFHIGEFEFFIHPDTDERDAMTPEHLGLKINLLDAETQMADKETLMATTIGDMIAQKRLGNWQGYWLAEQVMWLTSLGLKAEHLKIREHMKQELSFYSTATFDLDYTYPFGSQEIGGNANRGQYDLTQHMKESKQSLELYDEVGKKKIVPRVIEPTFGIDRIFLAIVCEAYDDNKERGNIVLHILPNLAPIKAGIFPLVKKDGVDEIAWNAYKALKKRLNVFYDESGSVGRRYARQDELGTPYCITVDYQTKEDQTVTVRDRESTEQKRVPLGKLPAILEGLIDGSIAFSSL